MNRTKPPPTKPQTDDASIRSHGLGRVSGGLLLGLWAAILVVTIVVVRTIPNPPVLFRWWEAFYRIGSIIYGGGQVGFAL